MDFEDERLRATIEFDPRVGPSLLEVGPKHNSGAVLDKEDVLADALGSAKELVVGGAVELGTSLGGKLTCRLGSSYCPGPLEAGGQPNC